MTSIFDTYFLKNLERVSSQSKPAGQTKGEGTRFSRVLADVERKEPLSSENRGLERKANVAPPAAYEPLTNLTPGEIRLVEPEPSTGGTTGEAQIDMRNPYYRGVKLTSGDVNAPAPRAPATPSLLSVERLDVPPLVPPTTPEIASVLPIEEPQPPNMPTIASAERIDAIRKQQRAGGPLDGGSIRRIIMEAGRAHGIDPSLGMAIAEAESSLRINAVSRDGHRSKGLFQLLDSTGHSMKRHVGLDEPYKPFDPAQNSYLGVGYLRRLHDIFSVETDLGYNMKTIPVSSAEDLEKLAVAAFNAGEGNVARAQARAKARGDDPTSFAAVEPHLPASTRSYVRRVTALRNNYGSGSTEA